MSKIFKIYLPAVRANTGMNQSQWAKALGVTPNTVFNWENGRSSPKIEHLRKMSELSGIPMEHIFLPSESDENESQTDQAVK